MLIYYRHICILKRYFHFVLRTEFSLYEEMLELANTASPFWLSNTNSTQSRSTFSCKISLNHHTASRILCDEVIETLGWVIAVPKVKCKQAANYRTRITHILHEVPTLPVSLDERQTHALSWAIPPDGWSNCTSNSIQNRKPELTNEFVSRTSHWSDFRTLYDSYRTNLLTYLPTQVKQMQINLSRRSQGWHLFTTF